MENNKINKKFSFLRRAESFEHAGRGLYIFLKSTHNLWVEISVFVLVVCAGFFFHITKIEWLIILIVSGIVFVSEAFNTAIEIDIELTSPTYHPYAKDTKDVAAGAVLIASILAVITGLMIFVPYLDNYLKYGEDIKQSTVLCNKPEKEIVENYLKENISNLSPEKEVLGGKFYVTRINWLGDNSGTIEYEDGHILLNANFSYDMVNSENNNCYIKINSFVIQ